MIARLGSSESPKNNLPALGLAVLCLALGLPVKTGSAEGFLVAAGMATFAALLFRYLADHGLYLGAAVIAGFFIVYVAGAGDAVSEGIALNGVLAPPADIALGVLSFTAGMSLMALMARFSANLVEPRTPKTLTDGRPAFVATFTLLLAVFFPALSAGRLSFWGGDSTAGFEAGAQGLEMFYPVMLFVTLGHASVLAVARQSAGRVFRWFFRVAVALTILGAFVNQSRRLMLAAGTIGFLYFWNAQVTPALTVPTRKRFWTTIAIASAVALAFLASDAWRRGDPTEGLTGRFSSVAESFGEIDVDAQLASRANYLWFEGIAHWVERETSVGLGDLFQSNLVAITPGILMPSKYEQVYVGCESLLGPIGVHFDIGCTPTGEGILVAGVFGFLFAVFLWGLTIGIANAAANAGRWPYLVVALLGVFQLIQLETGIFAPLYSVRTVLILMPIWIMLHLVLRSVTALRRSRSRSSIN